MRLLTGYAKPIRALAISHDGARLFSAAKGQSTVWEWDLAAGAVTQKLRGCQNPVASLAVTPDGKQLVAALAHGGVVAWPIGAGETRRLLEESADDHTVCEPTLSIHPAGRLVATPWSRYRDQAKGFLL